jgi:hypothetical protein
MPETDPLKIAASERVAAAAEEIQRQLSNLQGGGPILVMLEKAKHEAVDAYAALAIADPHKPDEIIPLQNRIRYFDEVMRWMKEIAEEGRNYDLRMTEQERDELADAIAPEPNRWLRGVAEPLGDDDAD